MKFIKTVLFNLSAIVLISSLFLVSCKDNAGIKDDALISVPAEVSSITAFNPEKLMAKADFENFKKQGLFQDALTQVRNTNPALAEALNNPAESGLDLSKNIYVNFELSPENMKEGFTYVMASIKNKSKFEAMLNKANLGDIETAETCKMTLGKGNIVFAWNDQTALMGKSNLYNGDSKAWAKKVFATTKETSIVNNKNLQETLKQNHDINIWNGSNGLIANPMIVMMAGMININEEDLKDNFIQSYVDFENGAIAAKSNFFLKKGFTKDIDILVNDQVKTDFSPFLPGQNLAFVTTAALNWRGLNQVLSEQVTSRSMINRYLKEFGTDLNELTKVLQGDIAFAVYSHEANEQEMSIFAAPIADKAGLQKLLDVALNFELIEKVGNGYELKLGKLRAGFLQQGGIHIGVNPARLLIKDDMLFISANEQLLEKLSNGKLPQAEQINGDQWKSLSKNIFGTFLDFSLVRNASNSMKFLSLENLNVSANRKSADFNVDMSNKEENSLKSLLQMLNEKYKEDQVKINVGTKEEDKKSM